MTDTRKAAQAVFDAFCASGSIHIDAIKQLGAPMKELGAALAQPDHVCHAVSQGIKCAMLLQPEQQAEPIAHICILPTKDAGPTKFFTAPSDPRGFPVYAHPPAQPSQPKQQSPSQKMRAAGFTPRDTRLTCDECGAKYTPQMAPLHECAQPEQQARHIDVLRIERDRARECYDRTVHLLFSVHALLYPAPITTQDGRTLVFRPSDPNPHEILQELSNRIRALPDELAKIEHPPAQPQTDTIGVPRELLK